VPWHRLTDYLRLGWLPVADLGAYHGQNGVFCEWKCNCRWIDPNQSEFGYAYNINGRPI
jgi:hypothetical protein